MKANEALDVLDRFGRTWFEPAPDKYWMVIDAVHDFFDFDPGYGQNVTAALRTAVYGLVDVKHLCWLVREAFGQPVSHFQDARDFLHRVLQDLSDDPFDSTQGADDEPF